MYKDKEKQKVANRANAKHYREKKGMTQGMTEEMGMTQDKSSYPDIIDKLTDPFWRERLTKICASFQGRRFGMDVTWLGDTPLTVACDWLECTE